MIICIKDYSLICSLENIVNEISFISYFTTDRQPVFLTA